MRCTAFVFFFFFSSLLASQALAKSHTLKKDEWAYRTAAELTFEEKIGQLFIVDFQNESITKQRNFLQGDFLERRLSGYFVAEIENEKLFAGMNSQVARHSKILPVVGMSQKKLSKFVFGNESYFPNREALSSVQNVRLLELLGENFGKYYSTLGINLNTEPILGITNNQISYLMKPLLVENGKNAMVRGSSILKGYQKYKVESLVDVRGDLNFGENINESLLLERPKSFGAFIKDPLDQLRKDGLKAIKVEADILSIEQAQTFSGILMTDMTLPLNQEGGILRYIELLNSGIDQFIIAPEKLYILDELIAQRGLLDQNVLDEKIAKILLWKSKMGLSRISNGDPTVEKGAIKALQEELFEQSTVVLKNYQNLLPINHFDSDALSIVTLGQRSKTAFVGFSENYTAVNHFGFDASNIDQFKILLPRLQEEDHVVVVIYPFQNQDGQLPEEIQKSLKFLEVETNVTIVAFDEINALPKVEHFSTVIAGFDFQKEGQKALVQVVFGALDGKGKLPVNVGKNFLAGQGVNTMSLGRLSFGESSRVGLDKNVLQTIDEVAQEAIDKMATPGCQVLVAKDGKVIFNKAYGYLTYNRNTPVTTQTIYDVASLTKVAATLQAVMFLTERGTINLDDPIGKYLPELWGTNKGALIVRDILTHQSGLISFFPFYRNTLKNGERDPKFYRNQMSTEFPHKISSGVYASSTLKDSVWKWVVETDLHTRMDKSGRFTYRYSDLGFIILKKAVENIINQPLEMFMHQNFYQPLGMGQTGFRPLERFKKGDIAPTNSDTYFRKALVQGTVQDETSAILNGVSGHAGLFSTANDLAKILQMNLQQGYYGGLEYFQNGTVNQFSKKQFSKNRRGLGWDKPDEDPERSPASEFASPETFGHTGFTGISAWVDPKTNLIYIFVSNRVHPSSNNKKISTLNIRKRIQDIVYDSMLAYRYYRTKDAQ